jgi:hypothetical protein
MMAISFGLIYSCKKDNPVHQAFIGANINGSPVVGQPSSAYIANKDSLQIIGQFTNQVLTMNIRFSGPGKYVLGTKDASFVNEPSGPVNGPILLDSTKTNMIIVDSYNPYTNVAAGTFELHFAGSSPTNLTNGQFWMSILPAN